MIDQPAIDRNASALIDTLASARRGFTGRQSLYAKHLTTLETVSFDSSCEAPTASVIKAPIMAALYHEIDRRRLSEDQLLTMQDQDKRYGTGVLRDLTSGRQFSVYDLCRLMIVLSDNTATRMLAQTLGIDRINEIFRSWGMTTTEFRYQTWEPHDPREYAVSSAEELAWFLERLDAGDLLSPGSTAACLAHLRAQQDHSQLPRWLPHDLYPERSSDANKLEIWNKTGQMEGVRGDAAIFRADASKWIVVSLLRDCTDRSFQLDNEGNVLNARTGLAIYDAWGKTARQKEH